MPVTDAHAAALRAFLIRDTAATVPLARRLDGDGQARYQQFASAALSVLACRRFPHYDSAAVIQYVASVRVKRIADESTYDFSPVAGENVMRFSLGQTAEPQPTAQWLQAVLALLDDLSGAELASVTDVDDLLAQSRALADRWQHADP